MTEDLLIKTDERGVCTLTLNRPEVHNAFNDTLIAALDDALATIAADDAIRVVVLTGAGRSFSAGADLNWMKKAAGYTAAENEADARKLSAMLHRLNTLTKPTIAAVNGTALGGGVGLVACADMAVGVKGAKFGLSEVRLGLTPATISPYVVAAIGARQARRYGQTGERFDTDKAKEINLLHAKANSEDDMWAWVEDRIADLLAGAPGAISDAKKLILYVTGREDDNALRTETARRIAARRGSAEGQEGLSAFLEHRAPSWVKTHKESKD